MIASVQHIVVVGLVWVANGSIPQSANASRHATIGE